eukprot:gene1169-217_t
MDKVFDKYETMNDAGVYNDLTNNEVQRLKTNRQNKMMLERKLMWMKSEGGSPSATITAKKEVKIKSKEVKEAEGEMYPPPFMDEKPDSTRIKRLVKDQEFLELESRLRTKLRNEKKKNAAILRKTPEPTMNEVTLDPIQRHVERRKVRVGAMLRANLEQLLSCNTTQILHDHLGEAKVSIVHLEADKSARGTQHVYYIVVSDHDKDFVQKQMETLAPKLRHQMAVKLELGHTPAFKFHQVEKENTKERQRLWRMVQHMRKARAEDLHVTWTEEMNWPASAMKKSVNVKQLDQPMTGRAKKLPISPGRNLLPKGYKEQRKFLSKD